MVSLLKKKKILAASGGVSALTYQQQIVADGAIAYWPLDDPSGTVARNLIGTNHGTITGGVTLNQPGVTTDSKSMLFSSGKITTLTTVSFPTPYTVEAWVRTTSGGQQAIVSTRNSLGGSGAASLDATSSGKLLFYDGNFANGVRVLSDNLWHHIVFVLTGTTIAGYIDAMNDGMTPSAFIHSGGIRFVQIGNDDAGSGAWAGFIQDVAVYPRALTPAEISSHFALRPSTVFGGLVSTANLVGYWKHDETSGNLIDSHGTNNLTDVGTVGSVAGKISTARTFNRIGGGTRFTIVDNASLSLDADQSFTLTAWLYLDVKEALGVAIGKWQSDGGSGNSEFYLGHRGTTDRFEFGVDGVASTGSVPASTLGAPSLVTWYFVVAWHDAVANTINIQVNNGVVDSVAHTVGTRDSTSGFAIGTLGEFITATWSGRIDEVAFFKRVLTVDERTALFNSGSGLTY